MKPFTVDIVCDRGATHRRRPGKVHVQTLARFAAESDPARQDFPGWRILPKPIHSGTPGQMARERANAPEVVPFIFDEEGNAAVIEGRTFKNVVLFPCRCGWPTLTEINSRLFLVLLNLAESAEQRTVHIDEVNQLATNGARLAVYAPRPLSEWETYARLSSTGSVAEIKAPDDSDCHAREWRGDGTWLQIVCDGGRKHEAWHANNGARVIASFSGIHSNGDSDYTLLVDDDAGGMGVIEKDGGYILSPCPCGRQFQALDPDRVHRVMKKLAEERIYCLSVDGFIRAVSLTP